MSTPPHMRQRAGSLAESSVSGLTVLGTPVSASVNGRVAFADWGYAVLLEQAVVRQNTSTARGQRGFVTAIHVHLTAAHDGLPAGTEIFVGYAEAAATAPKAVSTPTPPPLPHPSPTPTP